MAVSIPEQAAPAPAPAPESISIQSQKATQDTPTIRSPQVASTPALATTMEAEDGVVKDISAPQETPTLTPAPAPAPAPTPASAEKEEKPSNPEDSTVKSVHPPQPTAIDTTAQPTHHGAEVFSPVEIHDSHTTDFTGDLNTNNEIPSQETIKKIANISVLDRDGRSIPFKNIYSGPNVARRVLVIFIRHFFCGVCNSHHPYPLNLLFQFPFPQPV